MPRTYMDTDRQHACLHDRFRGSMYPIRIHLEHGHYWNLLQHRRVLDINERAKLRYGLADASTATEDDIRFEGLAMVKGGHGIHLSLRRNVRLPHSFTPRIAKPSPLHGQVFCSTR